MLFKDDFEGALRYLLTLEQASIIEITKRDKRSLNQNSYMHACIATIAIELGYTLDEMKIILLREGGYTYMKNGAAFVKRTSKMDKKEAAQFITFIRNWCSKEHGVYILDAEEYQIHWWKLEQEMDNNKEFLY